ENGVTAMVTPAMDYVGGLELGGIDVRYAGEDTVAAVGEGLRRFVSSLDDECTIHFVHRVTDGGDEDVRAYEEVAAAADGDTIAELVESRAAWLRKQRL